MLPPILGPKIMEIWETKKKWSYFLWNLPNEYQVIPKTKFNFLYK